MQLSKLYTFKRLAFLLKENVYLAYLFNASKWEPLMLEILTCFTGCTSNPRLYFGVKFYAADPCKLQEEITRYVELVITFFSISVSSTCC